MLVTSYPEGYQQVVVDGDPDRVSTCTWKQNFGAGADAVVWAGVGIAELYMGYWQKIKWQIMEKKKKIDEELKKKERKQWQKHNICEAQYKETHKILHWTETNDFHFIH